MKKLAVFALMFIPFSGIAKSKWVFGHGIDLPDSYYESIAKDEKDRGIASETTSDTFEGNSTERDHPLAEDYDRGTFSGGDYANEREGVRDSGWDVD